MAVAICSYPVMHSVIAALARPGVAGTTAPASLDVAARTGVFVDADVSLR
jgi:hypothetical protein